MRSIGLPSLSLFAVLAGGLVTSQARADLIDPAEEACGKAGEACTVDGRDGVCKTQTCSRLDYGSPGPDGTPTSKKYDCVRCAIGAKAAEAPSNSNPKPQGKGSGCSVEPITTSMLSFMLGLGLLGLAARRRR